MATHDDNLSLDRCLIRSTTSTPPKPATTAAVPGQRPLVATIARRLFLQIRAANADKLFIAHALDPDRRRLTYGELLSSALGIAHGLIESVGLRCGDRLAIVSPNHEHYHMAEFAGLFAGLVVVPVISQLTAHEGARLMAEVQPHAVIVHSSLHQVVRESLDQAKLTPRMLLLDSAAPESPAYKAGIQRMHDILVPGRVELPSSETQCHPDSVAFMLFTSGTTGSSKAVQITHRMLGASMLQLQAHAAAALQGGKQANLPSYATNTMTSAIRSDGISGFFHLSGTTLGITTANRGGTIYFLERFDAGDWLALVQTFKITQSLITPNNLVLLIKDPRVKQFDLSSLKIMSSVAAPLSAATQKRAMEILNVPIVQSYGSTETIMLTMSSVGRGQADHLGSVGRLLPGIEALLLDPETHAPLEVNTTGLTGPGELVVRSPSVFSEQTGYYNRPAESKAAFITIGGKSWFQTGDLLVMDVDGCLTVVDRCKEMFRVSGNQVLPTEIEAEILKIHDILDVAVVPVPVVDEQQLPCAAIVPRSKTVLADPVAQKALAKAVSDAIAQELAPYKHLTGGVVFMDVIPRNAMGKIVRHVARTKVLTQLGLANKAAIAV
ncbi:hypothetical protein AMAG_00920 [Allomyces macrogynus ATCC 38327]|uniref:AMP-dependent synthetase/ligase domain-containing protein n=1 Tax=Allomyces macrogynus (strain ATCC 38327) TaxID=578462 RepID=A0A0L0RXD6_ALLM3|nr:hypothetical protein AMAG_00920 [Allomyces macrogynus ATCC 38327]|eukprot:KNE54983.1 hypothetical protein AMAG_00920 [Allomyces macrogynus ATCC 38327]